MVAKTSDLCDAFDAQPGVLRVVEPMLRSFGGARAFSGTIATLKVHEDNKLVREALSEPGAGRVLVIDGGGSLRSALVGDQLAALADANGWAGIVVYGCIRDSAAIRQIPLGVLALGKCPRRSEKRGYGSRDVSVTFGGVTFTPGAWLCADDDGVVVADAPLDVPSA